METVFISDNSYLINQATGISKLEYKKYDTFFGANDVTVKSSAKQLTISKSVESLSTDHYANYEYLETVTFEDDSELTTIGSGAFQNCPELTTVNFGKNSKLEIIGFGAFKNCSKLTTVNFEENSKLNAIRPEAFYGCTELKLSPFQISKIMLHLLDIRLFQMICW